MAEDTTRKGTNEPQDSTKDAAHAKAPVETGDRELSDADLDRVSGGAGGTAQPKQSVEPLLDRSF